jgi:hypothetical protein
MLKETIPSAVAPETAKVGLPARVNRNPGSSARPEESRGICSPMFLSYLTCSREARLRASRRGGAQIRETGRENKSAGAPHSLARLRTSEAVLPWGMGDLTGRLQGSET